MTVATFAKTLSANDVGETGSHQAGIHVPKADVELLSFFPHLDPAILNPDAWIVAVDASGKEWSWRYVYYNNRLHVPNGTRNEYRLTHLRSYLTDMRAKAGDSLILTLDGAVNRYDVCVEKELTRAPGVIALQGWRRVH